MSETPSADPRAAANSPFDVLIGTEWLEMGPERATARLPVTPDLLQPAGLVHGGVYAVLAESVPSRATNIAVVPEGSVALGQANEVKLLRPVSGGALHALATRRHKGRTTWIWDVELTDDEGRLCALARMTLAIRPLPEA